MKIFSKILAIVFLTMCMALPALSKDSSIPDCTAGAWECSSDAYTLMHCEKGTWQQVDCMSAQGKLCESGKCVDPWRYGSPAWKPPAPDPRATRESLVAKAQYFEKSVERLHLHPKLKWVSPVILPCKAVKCAPGQKEPCQDCTLPSIPEEKATWKDVDKWHSIENDGLFSALYLAAEAFRYGATRDPQALRNIKILMEGEVIRMRITGVPGMFTRQYIPPGITGLKCPDKPEYYVRAQHLDENSWVKIDDGGCLRYVDGATKEWKTSSHCGLKEFAGWCWVDNVSKDEYSGHMFALGAVAKLVDDPGVQATAKDLIGQVARHLMKNNMEFVDWDGAVTPYGRIHAITFADYPGFNAAMALDFIKIAAVVTKDPEIADWYDNCLLQKKGRKVCLGAVHESPKKYTSYLSANGMFEGANGCDMNYDNTSMHMLSLHNLIWFEHDPALRETYQNSLDKDIFRASGRPRAFQYHHNAFYDMIFASQKELGPKSDGPAYDAVADAVAQLQQLPPFRHRNEFKCTPETCKPYCKDRFGGDTGQEARAGGDRCMDFFFWWSDPYAFYGCEEDKRYITPPTDYLLPYWMGRYYGFIKPDM